MSKLSINADSSADTPPESSQPLTSISPDLDERQHRVFPTATRSSATYAVDRQENANFELLSTMLGFQDINHAQPHSTSCHSTRASQERERTTSSSISPARSRQLALDGATEMYNRGHKQTRNQ